MKQLVNTTVLGKNIRTYRESTGLSRRELAKKVGVSYLAVSNWERGKAVPHARRMTALSQLFGVTPANLGYPQKADPIKQLTEENRLLREQNTELDRKLAELTQPLKITMVEPPPSRKWERVWDGLAGVGVTAALFAIALSVKGS